MIAKGAEADLRNDGEPNKLATAMLMCQGWGPDCADEGACQLNGRCFVGEVGQTPRHNRASDILTTEPIANRHLRLPSHAICTGELPLKDTTFRHARFLHGGSSLALRKRHLPDHRNIAGQHHASKSRHR
jgi:hypothetical protein